MEYFSFCVDAKRDWLFHFPGFINSTWEYKTSESGSWFPLVDTKLPDHPVKTEIQDIRMQKLTLKLGSGFSGRYRRRYLYIRCRAKNETNKDIVEEKEHVITITRYKNKNGTLCGECLPEQKPVIVSELSLTLAIDEDLRLNCSGFCGNDGYCQMQWCRTDIATRINPTDECDEVINSTDWKLQRICNVCGQAQCPIHHDHSFSNVSAGKYICRFRSMDLARK